MEYSQLDERQKARAETYKQGISVEAVRRKREETTVSIRKNKKTEQLKKRRQAGEDEKEEANVTAAAGLNTNGYAGHPRIENLQMMMDKLRSGDLASQVEATTLFRKLLSLEKNPPIEEVINAGAVPIFVAFLHRSDCDQLQFEAAWALTNIASGHSLQTRCVIENQAVPGLIALLSSGSEQTREQAIWCLGNIAGDSVPCRDYVLSNGVMNPLLMNIVPEARMSLLRNATWALSNLCRAKPPPEWSLVSPALDLLTRLVYTNDDEILTDALWALSYLSDGNDERIQHVVDSGCLQRVIEMLGHHLPSVVVPALRTIGNVVTGTDIQTQYILNLGALPLLRHLLQSGKDNVRKEASWAVSNVTAGTPQQVKAVVDANIVPELVTIMQNADNWKTKKEATWAVCNLTSGGNNEAIRYAASCGAVRGLCSMLTTGDARTLLCAVEGLDNILKVGQLDARRQNGVNPYAAAVDEANGIEKLDELQNHQNNDIYKKAMHILSTYFDGEEEQQDSALVPVTTQSGFAFGSNAPIVPTGGFRLG